VALFESGSLTSLDSQNKCVDACESERPVKFIFGFFSKKASL